MSFGIALNFEVIGHIGSYLPLENHPGLDLACGSEVSRDSLREWSEDIEKMPTTALCRQIWDKLQLNGERFKVEPASPLSDRIERIREGKASLFKSDWQLLEIDPDTRLETLSPQELAQLEERIINRESKKLVAFFTANQDKIAEILRDFDSPAKLEEILKSEQTPLEKAVAVCELFKGPTERKLLTEDEEIRKGLEEMHLSIPSHVLGSKTYRKTLQYIERYKSLLSNRKERTGTVANIVQPVWGYFYPHKAVKTAESPSLSQLDESGGPIALRHDRVLIHFLTEYSESGILLRFGSELNQRLRRILNSEQSDAEKTKQLRNEWLSSPVVQAQLPSLYISETSVPPDCHFPREIAPAILGKELVEGLIRDGNFDTASAYFQNEDHQNWILSHHGFYASLLTSVCSPELARELLLIARSSENVWQSNFIPQTSTKSKALIALIQDLVTKKMIPEDFLKDALALAIRHQSPFPQIVQLMRDILNANGGFANGLEFMDCVKVMQVRGLLDNDTKAKLLEAVLNTHDPALLAQFSKTIQVDCTKINELDAIYLWIYGHRDKKLLERIKKLSHPQFVKILGALPQQTFDTLPFNDIDDLLAIDLLAQTNLCVYNKISRLSTRVNSIPIETLASAFSKMEMDIVDTVDFLLKLSWSNNYQLLSKVNFLLIALIKAINPEEIGDLFPSPFSTILNLTLTLLMAKFMFASVTQPGAGFLVALSNLPILIILLQNFPKLLHRALSSSEILSKLVFQPPSVPQ